MKLDLFDKLCGYVEKICDKNAVAALNKAALFYLPSTSDKFLPKNLSDDECFLINEKFFLPFEIIAVEDLDSVVVLWDTTTNQSGWAGRRGFIEFSHTPESPKKEAVITSGYLNGVKVSGSEFYSSILLTRLRVFSGDKLMADLATEEIHDLYGYDFMREACKNANLAMQEVAYFNSPSRFVVEREQRKKKFKNKPNKVKRSFARSVYTLLTPKEINKKLGLGTVGEKNKKSPHARKRHYRTYRDDRFVNMKGETVLIPAVWVGPTESTHEGHLWKVRLDL